MRETLRIDAGDGWWLLRWPVGPATGRFAHQRGQFDPEQRLANIGFVVTIATLVTTGRGMTVLHGGPVFASLVRLHRLATDALTPLVAGHVLIALGVLPGYRGARRAWCHRARCHRHRSAVVAPIGVQAPHRSPRATPHAGPTPLRR